MTFQVRIQNLGKLADATVRVGDLTVLAGVNNTGKSFFSKGALCPFFTSMNADDERESRIASGLDYRLMLLRIFREKRN